MIEITRSFSRKINLGNYETCDFFCSAKKEADDGEEYNVSEISGELIQICMDEVENDIEEFKKEQKEKSTPTKQEEVKELNFKDVKINE